MYPSCAAFVGKQDNLHSTAAQLGYIGNSSVVIFYEQNSGDVVNFNSWIGDKALLMKFILILRGFP